MRLGNYDVGLHAPPFIIAEMSGNHRGSLSVALELVDAVADAGAHALKLQTYTPDSMTLDSQQSEFMIQDRHSLWNGRRLYELYQEASTPLEWHEAIFQRCKERGILCFSTPFDIAGVDFLEKLRTPFYKIASFENNHIPLIKKVAQTKKPLILSTGLATLEELAHTVSVAQAYGCKDLILLKCTSSYPASPAQTNLTTIPHMRDLFDCEVGLSDHTLGIGVSVGSVVLGATVIEKHVTLRRSDGGVDAVFSLEPHELKQLVEETKRVWEAKGSIFYGATEKEEKSRQFRRSIYISQDMNIGEVLTEQNMKVIRPGFGLSPMYYEQMLGKCVKVSKKRGEPLRWEDI